MQQLRITKKTTALRCYNTQAPLCINLQSSSYKRKSILTTSYPHIVKHKGTVMLTRTAWQPNDHADIASKRQSTYLLKPLSSHWNIGRPPGISIFPCPWPFFPVGSNSSQSVLLQPQLIFSMLFSGVLGSVYPEVPSKGMPGDIGKGPSVKVQLKKKNKHKAAVSLLSLL